MARITTIRTSIVSGGKSSPEAVTISSTSWSTDSGTLTLSAAVPGTVNIGDVIADSLGNLYLITGISGSDLTCQDWSTTTDPSTGAATINSAFATITLWEANLDAGTHSESYKSGDSAIGEVYNTGGAFDESLTIDGGGTIGLASVTLTVPENERHDGTAGTGVRNVRTGAVTGNAFAWSSAIPGTLSGIELDYSAATGSNRIGLYVDPLAAVVANVNLMLVHGMAGTTSTTRLVNLGAITVGATVNLNNSILYDQVMATRAGYSVNTGLSAITGSGRPRNIQNITIHHVHGTSDTDVGPQGVDMQDRVDHAYQNILITDVVNNGAGGGARCFELTPATATCDHNASDDATASGTGSLTLLAPADQYISTVVGSENLHLVSTSDCVGAGADLGTTPTDVQFDIDGDDRDTLAVAWDIGADQYVSAFADQAFSDDLNAWADEAEAALDTKVLIETQLVAEIFRSTSVADTTVSVTQLVLEIFRSDISFAPSAEAADDLNEWLDAATQWLDNYDFRDTLNVWGDAVSLELIIDRIDEADDLNLWADAVALQGFIFAQNLQVSVADSNAENWSDGLEFFSQGEIEELFIAIDELSQHLNDAVIIGIGLSFADDLDNWLDEVTLPSGIQLNAYDSMTMTDAVVVSVRLEVAVSDSLNAWSDSTSVLRTNAVGNGDQLLLSDQVSVQLSGYGSFGDTLAFSDSIALSLSGNPSVADDLNSWLDAVSLVMPTKLTLSVADNANNFVDGFIASQELLLVGSEIPYLRRYLNDVL